MEEARTPDAVDVSAKGPRNLLVRSREDGGPRRRYAVCVAGARDNYEAAIAFHEVGALDRLVTDIYLPERVSIVLRRRGILRAATARYSAELAGARVENHPIGLLLQSGWVRRNLPCLRTNQEHLAKAFERIGTRGDVDLFSYAGYAFEAFRRAQSQSTKVLFQYHPHRAMEGEILRRDKDTNPFDWLERNHIDRDPCDRRNTAELQLADKVVCASSFTMKSLIHIGIDPTRVCLIPYGVSRKFDAAEMLEPKRNASFCRMLYVGTGTQRKGLHLLLKAWAAFKSKRSLLTVVWRNPEPGLVAFAKSLDDPRVSFKENVPSPELMRLYAESHVFVLPSLVEGYGHVVLEALTAGCFTIATEGTCLPDLKPSPEHATVIPIGDVEALRRALEIVALKHFEGEIDHEGAMAFSQAFTWHRFRAALRDFAL